MQTARVLYDPEDVTHWLIFGKPGSRIVYHTGFLGIERFYRNMMGPKLGQRAGILLNASEKGTVHLFQKRLAQGQYLYMAEKRKTND